MPNLKQFIFNLEPYKRYKLKERQSPHFIIESTYQIKGIGIVVSGTMKDGIIKKPSFIPPWATNINYLVCFLTFSVFLEDINYSNVAKYYDSLLKNVK